MPLTISDESLAAMGMKEAEARVEIACRLFDAEKISLGQAQQIAGLTRPQMEYELRQRKIAIYRIDEQYLEQELRAVEQMAALDRTKEPSR